MKRKVVLQGHADAGKAEKSLVKPVSIERMKKAITQLAPAAAVCARSCDLWGHPCEGCTRHASA